jgi:hypothetical protein
MELLIVIVDFYIHFISAAVILNKINTTRHIIYKILKKFKSYVNMKKLKGSS